MSPQPQITMPPALPPEDTSIRKEEEPNMEHFAKAAENLVASLDDDDEEVIRSVLLVEAANEDDDDDFAFERGHV